jgi:hypothetical protein
VNVQDWIAALKPKLLGNERIGRNLPVLDSSALGKDRRSILVTQLKKAKQRIREIGALDESPDTLPVPSATPSSAAMACSGGIIVPNGHFLLVIRLASTSRMRSWSGNR